MDRFYCNRHSFPIGCDANQQCSLCKANAVQKATAGCKIQEQEDLLLKNLRRTDYEQKTNYENTAVEVPGGRRKQRKARTGFPNLYVENMNEIINGIDMDASYTPVPKRKCSGKHYAEEGEKRAAPVPTFDTTSSEWPSLDKDLYMNGFGDWIDISQEYEDEFGAPETNGLETQDGKMGGLGLEEDAWVDVTEGEEKQGENGNNSTGRNKPMPLFSDIVRKQQRLGKKCLVASTFPKDPIVLLNIQRSKNSKLMRHYWVQKSGNSAENMPRDEGEICESGDDQGGCYYQLKQNWHVKNNPRNFTKQCIKKKQKNTRHSRSKRNRSGSA